MPLSILQNRGRGWIRPLILPLISLPLLWGCSIHDYRAVTRVALAKDPSKAAKTLAKERVDHYAKNPQALSHDLQNIKVDFDKLLKVFIGEVSQKWGKGEARSASQKVYVKYTDHYKSRAQVDFEKGRILVETLDSRAPRESLKRAIVTTLLTPENPNEVDLYSDKEVKFTSKPYLAGLVKDHEQKVVLHEWRANRYADYLIKNHLKTRQGERGQRVHYVDFAMAKGFNQVKSSKYGDLVRKYARINRLDEALVLGIIQSESSFNPYAVSHVPAYGLMQVVPQSAGRDAHRELQGRDGTPTRQMLFDPETNIRYGTAYLKILFTRYLVGVKHPQSREYCVISAYNTGSGNVLKAFDKNRTTALQQINTKTPEEVYQRLRTALPYQETRNYLKKVTEAKRQFLVYKKP